MKFCEFRGVTGFSFLEGACEPEELVGAAGELGYGAVGVMDRGGFYGSARAYHAGVQCGVKVMTGATIEWDGAAVPVVCAQREGYRALSRHLTDSHLHGVLGEDFSLDDGSLVALTGGRDGPVAKAILEGNKRGALQAARGLMRCFGRRNVFVEISRHGLRDDGRLNRQLVDLAEYLRLPVLATNAPLYVGRGGRRLADAFACLRNHVPLDGAGRLLAANGERYLKSPKEMVALFKDMPEAVQNTLRLEERVEYTLENLGYRFPDFPDGRGNPLSLAEQATLLRRHAYAGASRRYGVCSRKVKDQLEHELRMIFRLGFQGYFLIVHELIEFANGRGILCQGRGSGANSVVCYALGITAVDPIGGGLLFERFLSENRKSWPDIDIDFPSGERREEVIQHVFKKYGERGAAMTANVITYRGKSAFREMSKVLGFPVSVADRFSERIRGWRGDCGEVIEKDDNFRNMLEGILPVDHPRYGALSHLYHAVQGMPRHLGQHSGGMIVCDHGLDSVVPLERARMPGRTVVQWDKDDCEDMGIVKIDLLGLGMLAAMEHALEIRTRRGEKVDLACIPMDDPAVFEMMGRADTIGTFQVESRAQMATLPIMRPKIFYDVAVQVAIIRPGPIVGDLVHPYLNRRNGIEKIDYIHPCFEDILKRTLGVPLFQEQVLRMAMAIADFTGAEADELRRAMAFKRSDERMAETVKKLHERMTARGITSDVQEKVVGSIGSFAQYGFPESHAISFGMIAYASCWLKTHFPAEFYAGLLNHQPMGFYSVNTLIQDAQRHKIRVRPVDVLESEVETVVVDDETLRLGLNRLKGVSKETQERIFRWREANDVSVGVSLTEFLREAGLNAKEKRILAQAGALNGLSEDGHRRDVMWQVELPLFDDLLQTKSSGGFLSKMSMAERLSADFATQGASVGPHPMKLWREKQKKRGVLRAVDLHHLPHGVLLDIAGMAICRQRPGTAKGHCFISLEDETGIANLFVPVKTYTKLKQVITCEPFLYAEGRLQRTEGDQPTVYVTHLRPLNGAGKEHATPSHDWH